MIKIYLLEVTKNWKKRVLINVLECPIYISELCVTGHANAVDSNFNNAQLDSKFVYSPACISVSAIMFGALNSIDKICPSLKIIVKKNLHKIIVTQTETISATILLNVVITQLLTVQKKFSDEVSVIINSNQHNNY